MLAFERETRSTYSNLRKETRFLLGLLVFVGLGGWLALSVSDWFMVLPLGWTILALLALRQRHRRERLRNG